MNYLIFPLNPLGSHLLCTLLCSVLLVAIHLHCSHEIKRCLFLRKKVMTNLDSIFKSRDITLPSKVHLVKAMVFPVVMYGCEWDREEG